MNNFEFKNGKGIVTTNHNPENENILTATLKQLSVFDSSKNRSDFQQQSQKLIRCVCGQPVSRDNVVFNRNLCVNCVTARNNAKMRIAPPPETATGKIYRLLVCHGCSGVFGEAKMQSAQLCKKCDSFKLRKINLLNVVGSFISRGAGNNGTR